MFKISVYTQVYNTPEPYVRKCIESVLNQTFTDFEYVIIDNGCTDGTSDVLREYDKKDHRIKLIRRDVNEGIDPPWLHLAQEQDSGEWIAPLDADDWWEINHLEHMVALAEETGADIVCTGTIMHDVKTGRSFIRAVNERLYFDYRSFATGLPYYHAFMRPAWAKLFRAKLFKRVVLPDYANLGITYGQDTLFCFRMLRKANALVLDNSVLHHYRINPSSVSYRYDTRRFDSDIYLYNDTLDFLSPYGMVSETNRYFLYLVYLNAVNDTIKTLCNADLDYAEKLNAIYNILDCDVSKKTFVLFRIERRILLNKFDEKTADQLYKTSFGVTNRIFGLLFDCLIAGKALEINIDLLKTYFPECYVAIIIQNISLFSENTEQRKSLLDDDRIGLILSIANLIYQKKYTKKYDLEEMIRKLAVGDNILLNISKSVFIRNNYDIYKYIVRKDYLSALECMTKTLVDTKKGMDKTFIWLYITLAALTNSTDEFLYGKLRSAGYLLYIKKYDECRAEINDLSEMGVEDNDEIIRIKRELEKIGK